LLKRIAKIDSHCALYNAALKVVSQPPARTRDQAPNFPVILASVPRGNTIERTPQNTMAALTKTLPITGGPDIMAGIRHTGSDVWDFLIQHFSE
jgi:hypothetical protein